MTVSDMLKDIREASKEVPFENSFFQTDNFIVKGQYTPARAYRAILLRLNDRIQALNEAKYNYAVEEVDIEELEAKIEDENKKACKDCFSIRRWSLDVARRKERREYTMKLVVDAINEVNHLYSLFKRFPRITRKQFEEEEKKHFSVRLGRQLAGFSGAADDLATVLSDESVPLALRVDSLIDSILESDASESDAVLSLEGISTSSLDSL